MQSFWLFCLKNDVEIQSVQKAEGKIVWMIHSSCFVVSPGSQVVFFFALSGAGWSHRRFKDHLPAPRHAGNMGLEVEDPHHFEKCVWKYVKIIINDCSLFNLGFFLRPCQRKKWMKTERICHNADAFEKPKMKIDKPKSYSVFTPQLKIIPGFPSVLSWILIFPNWLNREPKPTRSSVLQNIYCVARWICVLYIVYI